MRTWRQGAVGALDLPGGRRLYLLCLRYPLARFHAAREADTGRLLEPLFECGVSLATVRLVERLDLLPLRRSELGPPDAAPEPLSPEGIEALLDAAAPG